MDWFGTYLNAPPNNGEDFAIRTGPFSIDNVEIQNSKKGGRGVFARKPIPKGSIVEDAPFLAVYQEEVVGELMNYVFVLDDHCYALCLGYGSLYNHSKSANVDHQLYPNDNRMSFTAIRDIEKGEELTVSYGDGWLENRGLANE